MLIYLPPSQHNAPSSIQHPHADVDPDRRSTIHDHDPPLPLPKLLLPLPLPLPLVCFLVPFSCYVSVFVFRAYFRSQFPEFPVPRVLCVSVLVCYFESCVLLFFFLFVFLFCFCFCFCFVFLFTMTTTMTMAMAFLLLALGPFFFLLGRGLCLFMRLFGYRRPSFSGLTVQHIQYIMHPHTLYMKYK